MDRLQTGKPLFVGSCTLLPVERSSSFTERGNAGCWFTAHKEPYAIIIHNGDGVRAFSADAKEIHLDELTKTLPGITVMLASLPQSKK